MQTGMPLTSCACTVYPSIIHVFTKQDLSVFQAALLSAMFAIVGGIVGSVAGGIINQRCSCGAFN